MHADNSIDKPITATAPMRFMSKPFL